MINKYFLFIVFFLFITACQKKSVNPEEYVQYINNVEHGLLKKVEVGNFKIEVQLRPIEYEIIQEIGIENITKEKLEEGKKDNRQEFFLLRIGSKDNQSDALTNGLTEQREYFERIGYLISNIDKDIYIVEGNDTIRCAMHHFERSYHLSNYHNVLLVFDRPVGKNDITDDQLFVYDDAILGIGKLSFKFENKSINNIPNILL